MPEELDLATEVSGLRREVFEMRNLVIKTDNLLKTFHTELKDVSRKHAVSEKRHQLGHVAGYAAIGIVALVSAILYGHAAGSGARAEASTRLEEAKQKQAEAETLLARTRQQSSAQDHSSTEAMSVWQLLTAGDVTKQDEGLARMAKLDTSKLTPFTREALERTATSLRRTRAEDTLAAAFAEKPGDPSRSAAAFEKFLTAAGPMPASWHPAERLLAAYQLGALYNQLGQHDKAIPLLKKYVAEGNSSTNKAYAYLLLGDSLEHTGKAPDAAEAYKAGLRLQPSGMTLSQLKKRLGADAPT